MIQRIFMNMLEISITISVVILLMCIISPYIGKKYTAKWKYYVWLGIAIRLLIPISLTIPNAPIQINTEQVFQGSESWQSPLLSEIVINDEIQSSKVRQENSLTNISLLQISSVVWISGACAFFIYHVFQYLYYIKNIKRWSLGVASQQKIMFTKIKDDLRIKRKISLRHCKIIKSPLMFGIIQPTVLIPCTEYSETDLYLILKHELIHYKRHDIEVKVIMFMVQTLYWFNPLIHLMSKKMNETIEMVCDEYVINGNDVIYKKRYMETILHSVKQQTVEITKFTSNYNGGIKIMKKRFQNIIYSGNKKKGIVTLTVFIVAIMVLSSLVACSSSDIATNQVIALQQNTNEENREDIAEIQRSDEILEPKKISENIVGIYAELERNAKLEKTIIEYLEIPKDYLAETKYYYNYVDLNGDGFDEIFTVVMGPYTSGTGGSTALHIIQTPTNEMHVKQKFTLIQTPIIISDKVTNGYKEIIVMRSGGGIESNYVVLTASDDNYTTVNDGTVIKGLEGVSGKAIICNDIVKDMEQGKAFYLQKD